jgi:hypothetical protein
MENDKKVFRTEEAAEYLGLTHNEMLNEITYRGSIKPAVKGRGVRIFTRDQLDDWKANDGHTDLEANGTIFDIKEAAGYLGKSVNAMGQIYYVRQELPAIRVSNTLLLFHKRDLDEWKRQKEEAKRTLVAKKMVVPVIIKEALDARVEAEGTSLYQVVAEVWEDWVNGRRHVSLDNIKAYRIARKDGVFARVDEGLATAVDDKCAKTGMKISYVTSQLLAQWVVET